MHSFVNNFLLADATKAQDATNIIALCLTTGNTKLAILMSGKVSVKRTT